MVRYLKGITLALNMLVNALAGAHDPPMAISARAGFARDGGSKVGACLCEFLDWFDVVNPDHCRAAQLHHYQRTQGLTDEEVEKLFTSRPTQMAWQVSADQVAVFIGFPPSIRSVDWVCLYGEFGEERCGKPDNPVVHVLPFEFWPMSAVAQVVDYNGMTDKLHAYPTWAWQRCERAEKPPPECDRKEPK